MFCRADVMANDEKHLHFKMAQTVCEIVAASWSVN